MNPLEPWLKPIEQALEQTLPQDHACPQPLLSAMRYSLLGGGKRLRPALVLEACKLCGGDVATAMPFAVAVECIHTYSLIHDDLPGMDNDDFRRGRPTCHKVYGVGMATLAGDGLLNLAMEIMLMAADTIARLEAARTIAKAAGVLGMVGGQCLDMDGEGKSLSLADLQIIHDGKTGVLLTASLLAGALCANATDQQKNALSAYGQALGLLFQITDDLLIVDSDAKTAGKTVSTDQERGKNTYVTLLGASAARQSAQEQLTNALAALKGFGAQADGLRQLAQSLPGRAY